MSPSPEKPTQTDNLNLDEVIRELQCDIPDLMHPECYFSRCIENASSVTLGKPDNQQYIFRLNFTQGKDKILTLNSFMNYQKEPVLTCFMYPESLKGDSLLFGWEGIVNGQSGRDMLFGNIVNQKNSSFCVANGSLTLIDIPVGQKERHMYLMDQNTTKFFRHFPDESRIKFTDISMLSGNNVKIVVTNNYQSFESIIMPTRLNNCRIDSLTQFLRK
jgi:hypothetical protein